MVNSTHGSSPFQATYGGLHKPVRVMHSFLLRNGNLLYTIFLMYVHEWDNDPKALFPKCVHPTLSSEEERSKKWLRSGSVAHNAQHKVQDTLLQDTFLWNMKKLSGFIKLARLYTTKHC